MTQEDPFTLPPSYIEAAQEQLIPPAVPYPMTPQEAKELIIAYYELSGVTGLPLSDARDTLKEVLEWDYNLKCGNND